MEISDIKSLQIHAFADSSERAYAANIYVRVETQTEISSQLVSAKTRVTPLEPITLPRLELLSGLLHRCQVVGRRLAGDLMERLIRASTKGARI